MSILGPAGTGKTLLALAAGLHQVVNQGKYTKLIVSRALIPHSRDIGTLPGGKEEKLSPWMGAIFDNLEFLTRNFAGGKYDKKLTPAEQVDRFMEEGFIELEALAYIRGRSIPGQWVSPFCNSGVLPPDFFYLPRKRFNTAANSPHNTSPAGS